MKELALKYGCNPNQKPSRIYMEEGELPIEVINGRPGYIKFLTCLKLAAAGRPVAAISSRTSCQRLSASWKLM